MPIAPGAILRGKYQLHASIGKGGMGEVFESVDLLTGQQVAIKVVSRHFVDDLLMARLHREAEAARRIHSPFVPFLYEVDYTDEDREELFLAMERLKGETLAERMRRKTGAILGWQEVSRIGDDVLSGLIDAHAAGVIHRDLKPGNIFLETDEHGGTRARILDFGVCKLDTHDGDSLTSTGEAVGTISYMAPEQIRGASRVDERADLYAFAMVVFEALSGRLAYDASGQIAMIACKLERTAMGLRQAARVTVPAGLEALLARCLSRRPADRPASAAELLKAWRALGQPVVVPNPTPMLSFTPLSMTGPEPTEPETAVTTVAHVRLGGRATRVGLVVAAAALLASSVVLVIGLRATGATGATSSIAATGASAASPANDDGLSVSPASDVVPAPASPAATGEPALVAAPASAAVDAGAASAAKPRPRGPGRASGATPRHGPPGAPPSGPQISTEPRY